MKGFYVSSIIELDGGVCTGRNIVRGGASMQAVLQTRIEAYVGDITDS